MEASRPSARTVDVSDAVLVLIDLQERLAAAMADRGRVVAAAGYLAEAASILGMPVIMTRQYPKGLGDTVSELAHVSTGAIVVDKTAFCCAAEPAFAEALSASGRGQAVLCGMETHICVTQTALALLEEGRRVHIVADACCSRRALDHDLALERMRSAGAEITTLESVVYEALREAGNECFRATLDVVKRASALGG